MQTKKEETQKGLHRNDNWPMHMLHHSGIKPSTRNAEYVIQHQRAMYIYMQSNRIHKVF